MEKPIRDHGILDEIGTIYSKGESGRLRITTGMTEGALFFKNGQLVAARLGNLTGFNAINAVASIPDASFTFNPAIAPPPESSMTPSERILLKDFFGIETVEPGQSRAPESGSWPNDNFPAEKVVPITDMEGAASVSGRDAQPTTASSSLLENEESLSPIPALTTKPNIAATTQSHLDAESQNASDEKQSAQYSHEEQLVSDAGEEVTLVRSKVTSAEHPGFVPYQPPSKSLYRTGLLLTALAILIAGAVVFLYKLRDRSLPATAAIVQTTSPANGEQVTNSNDLTSAAPDLTGNWRIINTVEQTSYQPFKNLEVGFNLSIDQNGTGFTGKGQKVSENGRSLPASGRTPIVVKGSIDGDRVEATFFEEGAVRKTQGRFVWRIEKAGAGLTGTFVSTAARASGKSAAFKDL